MSAIRGAVLVLGSCGQALAVGLKAEGNTVVLLMFDADDAFRCEQRLREEKLTNVFVAVPGPGEFLESAVSLVLSQSAVNYNACLLNGLSELTEGLLPHEVEESMAKLLTVSRRLIVHFDVSNDRVEFFKAAWENPKGLLQKVCALSGVRLCSFNLSSGVGLDWNDSTFVVGGQECVNGSSKSLPCPGPDGSVPFNSLLNYNLTAESKLSLFSSLLGATVSIDDPALLMVKGGEIKRSSQSANRQSKFISEDFVQKPLRHDSRLKQSGIPLTSKSEAPHVDKGGQRKLLDFDPLHIAQPFDIAKQFKWKFSGESPAVGDGQDSVPLWKRSRNRFLSLDSTPQPTVLPSSTGSSNNTEKKYEEKLFQALWSMVRPLITRKLKRGADLAAFVSGQCYMSMLSTKLSLLNPSASVLALDADRCSKCHKKYSGLLESSGAKNNFLVRKVLDPDITFDMSHRPQVFDVQVIGPEVFSWLLHLGTEFPEFLGRILTLSRVTVIEVPSWDTGRKTLSLFPIDGLELMNDFKTLVDLSLSIVGAGAVSKVKELTNSQWKVLKETRVFAVHLESFSRNVYMSCVNSQSSLTRLDIWPSSITYRSSSETKSLSVRGLCLQILLSLDSEKSFRTRLFQSYLRVKLHPDMCPAQLHWRDGALRHLSDTDTDSESETLTMLIKKEIHEKRYSFMDYNSNNSSVGRSLAVGSPNSTFLLARPTHLQASHLSDVLNADGLTNCLSLRLPVTASYTNNIMKSPDIFRYQYFDFLQLLFAAGSTAGSVAGYEDDVEFQVKVGEILASSVTSFITLPSPEILSLAATTFFPGTFLDNPELISDNVPAFQLADKVLLMQTPRADVDIKVHSSFLRHQKVPGSTGARFPWSVGVVRVMDLKLEVDHHFNFELDHHARKYTQFCHRDNVRSQPHVYLRRHEDDYKINYGNVNAISLIALLRMGLLPADKAKFYNSFVELPLYEDMAPWNIVYRGGHLEYIDQDTKDKTFDKLVPLAYQVMLVLVNYRRTVEDFRHCGDSASMLVDIPGIASCVRSQFGGPCNDSRYPVPCGDKSCRSTYIECLQVMQRKVKNKDTAKSVEQSSHVRKASSEVWGFGNNGMKD